MRELTEREEKAFRDAVTGGTYDRERFEKAVSVIRWQKALTPAGVEYSSKDWPNGVREWRARSEWAIDLLERHQTAARSAYAEYWRVFMSSNATHEGAARASCAGPLNAVVGGRGENGEGNG